MTGPVLILGARSDIARAIARAFAAEGHPIQLAARHAENLGTDRDDLQTRYGVEVSLHDFDALEVRQHEAFVDGLPVLPEIVVSAIGVLGDQTENEDDVEAALGVIRANFEGPALILGVLANRFATRGSGTIVGISSVAGDRGRASNYVYGSAKAGFTAFLSGLRNRLARQGVHVVTVQPGFVNTAMTAGMDTPGALTAEPSEVGEAIVNAVKKGRNVIYVRRIWWLVMSIICAIPEAIFKKTSI
ncbi:SDR family oxidoreductase [Alterinioella nitratireducens]|uniref:SDR family oxidoreductase n=1 Tax=Alterinioella nitratireducens TaxID=2735915 RepID=UPI00155412AA|nr:SDR family oxidoreductase [Alterinioella nitratireducens]NPD20535.1 SDR family oxidoreductase [Alterinioella nitratireducens]